MNLLQSAFAHTKMLSPHARGRAFERVLSLMLAQEEIQHGLAYRPDGEEIDGWLQHEGRMFLLEAKWHKDPISASSVYSFKCKVDGKFSGTCGIFISMSGYSEECVPALVHGKDLNILLFDEKDVKAIVQGEMFTTVLTEKLAVAGRTGEIYVPWPKLRFSQQGTERNFSLHPLLPPEVIPLEGDLLAAILSHSIAALITTQPYLKPCPSKFSCIVDALDCSPYFPRA
jgi:hypothetical protein